MRPPSAFFSPPVPDLGRPSVYLDGDYIGTLHGGRYFCFALAPGQHSFVGATGRSKFWKGSLTATLAAGRLYYLESSTAYKRFKPIPNRQAFKEQTADAKDLGSSAKVRWVSLPLPTAQDNYALTETSLLSRGTLYRTVQAEITKGGPPVLWGPNRC